MNARAQESKGAALRRIYAKFMTERQKLGLAGRPVSLNEVYEFANFHGLWNPPKYDVRTRFRKEMGQALREGYFQDDRGRNVRRYHAGKRVHIDEFGVAVQEVLWADMLSDPPPEKAHINAAFKGRRDQIVGDCYQLKVDVEYYNDKHSPDEPIRMLWDMTMDVEERDQPTEYTAEPSDEG